MYSIYPQLTHFAPTLWCYAQIENYTKCTALAKIKPLKPINCIICILFAVKLQSHFIDHWIRCELNVHSFTAQMNWNAIKFIIYFIHSQQSFSTHLWAYAMQQQQCKKRLTSYYNTLSLLKSVQSHTNLTKKTEEKIISIQEWTLKNCIRNVSGDCEWTWTERMKKASEINEKAEMTS